MKVRLICFLAVTFSALIGSLAVDARQEANSSSKMPGQSIYDDTCSRCHGARGRDGKAPELVPFRWNYDQALDIVRHGGSCGMPSFKESELSDEEVKQIVDYMKTLN